MMLRLRIPIALSLFIYAFGAMADGRSFRCGNNVVHVQSVQKGELSTVQVDIRNANDTRLVKSVSGGGEVVSLCKVKEVLVLDTNSQYAPSSSILLSDSGKELMRQNFGIIDAFDKSSDDKVFWIQSKDVMDKVPVTRVRVFGYDGSAIESRIFHKAGVLSVMFQGLKYQIKVIEPDYPG